MSTLIGSVVHSAGTGNQLLAKTLSAGSTLLLVVHEYDYSGTSSKIPTIGEGWSRVDGGGMVGGAYADGTTLWRFDGTTAGEVTITVTPNYSGDWVSAALLEFTTLGALRAGVAAEARVYSAAPAINAAAASTADDLEFAFFTSYSGSNGGSAAAGWTSDLARTTDDTMFIAHRTSAGGVASASWGALTGADYWMSLVFAAPAGAAAGPSISTQPVSQAARDGQTVSITCVGANITGTPTYTLQRLVAAVWTTQDDNSGGTFTLTMSEALDGAQYRVILTDNVGEVISDTIALTFVPESIGPAWWPIAGAVPAGTWGWLGKQGAVVRTGVIEVIEASDLVTGAGAVDIAGGGAVTEPVDLAVLTGAVVIEATAAAFEAQDTAAAVGAVVVSGDLAVTEPGADVAVVRGQVDVAAQVAVTEAHDVASVSGALLVSGGIEALESADAVIALGDAAVAGAAAAIEAQDAPVATGAVVVSGDLVVIESGADVAVMRGQVDIAAQAASTEAPDLAQALGAVVVSGDLAVIESPDVPHALGTVGAEGTVGYVHIVESADVAYATGAVTVSGHIAVSDAPDIARVVGAAIVAGTLTAHEAASDVLSAIVSVAVSGVLAVREADDIVTAQGTVTPAGAAPITGVIAAHESADVVDGLCLVIVQGRVAALETADRVAAAGTSEGPAMPTYADDILFVAPRIVERLRARVPALREVAQFDSVDMDRGPRQTPAALVMFDREILPSGEDAKRTVKQIVRQRWLVLVAVRSADQEPGRYGRSAGAYIAGCVQALQGWTPAGTQRPLVRVTPPAPAYGKDTSYFPLAFEQLIVTP